MTRDQIASFLKLQPKLHITHEEISLLSKKNPNDAVNKFKVKLINGMLTEANEILGSAYKPLEDFTLFSEDEIPTNSDIVFILSPYLRSLKKLRFDNVGPNQMGEWFWKLDGKLANGLRANSATMR